jgi:hypothetical protein
LELDPVSDPAWTFCENHHKTIIDKLVPMFKDASRKTQGALLFAIGDSTNDS